MSAEAPDRHVTRVAAYTLCVEAGRLLLCRIAPGPWSAVGSWTLPGGGELRGEPDGSTDRAAWFSPAELAELPLVPLAREGARLAFGVELPER